MAKYETFGAHPDAHFALLGEAIDFLQDVGISRIRSRLFELTSRWTARAERVDGFRSAVRVHSDHCAGLVAWELEGLDRQRVRPVLNEHRLLVGETEAYAGFFGIPSDRPRRLFIANAGVFTSPEDVDRLADAIELASAELA
jgi:selenocysteine lyase/cysteine desulfurase